MRATLAVSAVAITIALTVSACGGGGGTSFSSVPADYVPTTVAHRVVTPSGSFAGSVAKSLSTRGSSSAATGTLGKPTVDHPFPEAVFLAIHGDDASVASVDERVKGTFLAGGTPTTSTIDDTKVTASTFRQANLKIGVATAAPRSDTRLVVLSFDGSPTKATDLLTAMLEKAKT